ncbi:hypothetical protein ABPG75_005342 [Micractinium tetrahymenae]
MPARYFRNRLPDYVPGTPVAVDVPHTLQTFSAVLREVLGASSRKPSVYTGAVGVAYALWHCARHVQQLAPAATEADLLGSAERYARAALEGIASQPPDHYGWSLLAGHAGVYATAALVFDAAAAAAERHGRGSAAEGLRVEREQCVQHYAALSSLAASSACQEDEVLYGRSGYLLGCLLLDRHLSAGSLRVTGDAMQMVVQAVIASGRRLAGRLRDRSTFPTPLFYMWPPGPDASPYLGAAHGLMGRRQAAAAPGCPSPLWFQWHGKPYLGAAHGMTGILFALLQLPEAVAAIPGAQADVEAALRYVLTLECDAEGLPGQGGHYPTQMGPWRDREPLVHWCHGATGAVFLFCQAAASLGPQAGAPYLAAAQRAGQSVWERGLLKKGPGCCHGVSGSVYALLRLHKATGDARWLHRALQFAAFMEGREFIEGARTPDHPLSLFEGGAARLCLLADLAGGPQSAAFPMFEVEF